MNKKWWCLFGVHEWKIIEKGTLTKTYMSGREIDQNYHVVQCDCCGKIKEYRT